jgi:pyrimidine operon attenuation protein / uracil phosphoribosyltransferase
MSTTKKAIINIKETIPQEKVERAIRDLAVHISTHFDLKSDDHAIVGIQTRGFSLAKRVADILKKEKGIDLPVGALDITLYRDDVGTSGIQPMVGETHLDFDINDKRILLIDDVLYTGRTVRAAIDELIDFGRPKSITLLVLIDRGHRELPIEAAFSALKISTKPKETVILRLSDVDKKEEIVIGEVSL